MSGPILVNIFDDRMEIVSIGGLVPGLSVDDILQGDSEGARHFARHNHRDPVGAERRRPGLRGWEYEGGGV